MPRRVVPSLLVACALVLSDLCPLLPGLAPQASGRALTVETEVYLCENASAIWLVARRRTLGWDTLPGRTVWRSAPEGYQEPVSGPSSITDPTYGW